MKFGVIAAEDFAGSPLLPLWATLPRWMEATAYLFALLLNRTQSRGRCGILPVMLRGIPLYLATEAPLQGLNIGTNR